MDCGNQVNLQIYKNKTKTWEILFTKDNAGIDISDYTVYLIVKEKKSDIDANAKLTITVTSHSDAVNGKTEIHLTKANTNSLDLGQYYYSVEYNDGESGDDLDEGVLYEGRLTILRPTRIG